MNVHELKCWPEPFNAAAGGRKTFEFRRNDRGFAEGDTLVLREWDPSGDGRYTGRSFRVRVGYVLRGPAFGVPENWAVMSLQKPPTLPKPRRVKVKLPRAPRVEVKVKTKSTKRIPKKPARQWVRITSGGLPTLGKK